MKYTDQPWKLVTHCNKWNMKTNQSVIKSVFHPKLFLTTVYLLFNYRKFIFK